MEFLGSAVIFGYGVTIGQGLAWEGKEPNSIIMVMFYALLWPVSLEIDPRIKSIITILWLILVPIALSLAWSWFLRAAEKSSPNPLKQSKFRR
ncbi:hypothetical protein DDZ13_15175 [Coraliomargarita sinensis]|uniref:Uncharacterized protein n=2 Tax=Coraliomargarita sinensis TaxID=2174842 RepID=A0A317ZEQ7_9BACT|nr:hypothetical protein DDZ13_15175 [Coraliomargarita sinensis]